MFLLDILLIASGVFVGLRRTAFRFALAVGGLCWASALRCGCFPPNRLLFAC